MHHDPHLRAAANAADASRKGWFARVSAALGFGEAAPEAPAETRSLRDYREAASPWGPGDAIAQMAEVTAAIEASAAASAPAEMPTLEAMAAALAELIATAELRIDGAAALVGRSAEEARAYGAALAHEAAAIDPAKLGGDAASQLITITKTMIEATRGAETRLRTMGAELETLHRDLADARTCAERDQLTGLPNRRALEGALLRAVAATAAANRALSLAFCDIDHFKRINDTHGHALGDRVLRLVADVLEDGAGEGVFVGRQGGEEFIMLFDGIEMREAAVRVDAIRAKLAARELKSRANNAPIGSVTFSAGVAELRRGETGDDLLRRADAALYRAKEGGRNRIEIDSE